MTQFVLWLVIPATIAVCAAAVGQLSARRNRIDRAAVDNQVALVLEQIRRNEAEAADVGLTAADRRWLADVGVAEWGDR